MPRFVKLTAPLLALLVIFSLATVTHAGDKGKKTSLDRVKLGTHVYGRQVKDKDLSGKVVVFEYWGDRCGPCIRAIPHLVEIQKEYSDVPLAIIANQVWTKNIEKAKNAWIKAGGSDQIAVINHGKLKGPKFRGVPRTFVFDHTGALVWEGHPANKKQLDTAIKKAVEKAKEEKVSATNN